MSRQSRRRPRVPHRRRRRTSPGAEPAGVPRGGPSEGHQQAASARVQHPANDALGGQAPPLGVYPSEEGYLYGTLPTLQIYDSADTASVNDAPVAC